MAKTSSIIDRVFVFGTELQKRVYATMNNLKLAHRHSKFLVILQTPCNYLFQNLSKIYGLRLLTHMIL